MAATSMSGQESWQVERVTTGADLLRELRAVPEGALPQTLRNGSSVSPPEVGRAALVACLLTSSSPADAPLVRELTRQEIAWVEAGDSGCGDVLLACCWLLFMGGDLDDAALVWAAKNVNFDAYCYIDSSLLVPQGPAATALRARSRGLSDLADHVDGLAVSELQQMADAWRSGDYFSGAPSTTAAVDELAAWVRQ